MGKLKTKVFKRSEKPNDNKPYKSNLSSVRPVWTPASMGTCQNLWKYRTISHHVVSGQAFTILEAYRPSPWTEHGCPVGFEHFIDGHEVPSNIFDRALMLAKKAA